MLPRALVVEDDAPTREALRALIEYERLTVEVAIDGEQALGMLMQRDYDVILLDIALPKISGADLMDHLASTRPQMLERIIVVTGLDVADIRKLFPTVCTALAKPVIPSRLRECVRRCLVPADAGASTSKKISVA